MRRNDPRSGWRRNQKAWLDTIPGSTARFRRRRSEMSQREVENYTRDGWDLMSNCERGGGDRKGLRGRDKLQGGEDFRGGYTGKVPKKEEEKR